MRASNATHHHYSRLSLAKSSYIMRVLLLAAFLQSALCDGAVKINVERDELGKGELIASNTYNVTCSTIGNVSFSAKAYLSTNSCLGDTSSNFELVESSWNKITGQLRPDTMSDAIFVPVYCCDSENGINQSEAYDVCQPFLPVTVSLLSAFVQSRHYTLTVHVSPNVTTQTNAVKCNSDYLRRNLTVLSKYRDEATELVGCVQWNSARDACQVNVSRNVVSVEISLIDTQFNCAEGCAPLQSISNSSRFLLNETYVLGPLETLRCNGDTEHPSRLNFTWRDDVLWLEELQHVTSRIDCDCKRAADSFSLGRFQDSLLGQTSHNAFLTVTVSAGAVCQCWLTRRYGNASWSDPQTVRCESADDFTSEEPLMLLLQSQVHSVNLKEHHVQLILPTMDKLNGMPVEIRVRIVADSELVRELKLQPNESWLPLLLPANQSYLLQTQLATRRGYSPINQPGELTLLAENSATMQCHNAVILLNDSDKCLLQFRTECYLESHLHNDLYKPVRFQVNALACHREARDSTRCKPPVSHVSQEMQNFSLWDLNVSTVVMLMSPSAQVCVLMRSVDNNALFMGVSVAFQQTDSGRTLFSSAVQPLQCTYRASEPSEEPEIVMYNTRPPTVELKSPKHCASLPIGRRGWLGPVNVSAQNLDDLSVDSLVAKPRCAPGAYNFTFSDLKRTESYLLNATWQSPHGIQSITKSFYFAAEQNWRVVWSFAVVLLICCPLLLFAFVYGYKMRRRYRMRPTRLLPSNQANTRLSMLPTEVSGTNLLTFESPHS